MRISDWSSDVCSSDLLSHMPAEINASEVASVVGMALFLSFAATLYPAWRAASLDPEIGRASCRERVCQYVSISVVAVSLKTKNNRSQYIRQATILQLTTLP